jgi:D-alanine transaminase
MTMSDPRHAWIGDHLVPWSEAVVPLEDRGLQFAESLYEVIPVTAGRARLVAEHAARMAAGAEALGLAAAAPSAERLHVLAERLIAAEEVREGLLYAQLTGGTAPRRHLPETAPTPAFFAYLRPFRFPRSDDVATGIAVITVPELRWGRCDLKTTMLLPAVLAKREAARRGAREAFLIGPDGLVHEGASSNVHVLQGDTVMTPPATTQLLKGTIRSAATSMAQRQGLAVEEGTVTVEDLFRADEVFVTSTTLLAMPVIEVDGCDLGSGTPGPVATGLATGLRQLLELEP